MKNRIKDMIVYLSCIIFVASNILVRQLNNLDELWNFNFANCVSNGLIPYKDFNMVQTPLLPLICGNILKIFGQEIYVMRFLAVILCSSILFLMYKILGKLKVNDFFKFISLIFSAFLMNDYFTIDYNWATLFTLLIIIYLEIPKKYKDDNLVTESLLLKHDIKKDTVIGLLAGICIMLKQNTGLLISIVSVCYKVFEIRYKGQIKEFIKIAINRAVGVLLPIIIIGIYLFINGAIEDFVDYCILGVSTFTNKISYAQRLLNNKNIIYRVLSIMPILLFVMFILYFVKKEKNYLIISLYGMAEFIIVYPISDESHFVIALCLIFIATAYLINKVVEKIFASVERYKKINFVLSNTIMAFMIVVSCLNAYEKIEIYKELNINYEIKHYMGIAMSEIQMENIRKIDEYISNAEKNIYVLDAQAAIYMIPIDRYNKNYDMFLKGNLGSKGEEGQIENLQSDAEKIVLILNDKYLRNWQNPENVRKYIIQNMNYVGEIGVFDIYE